MTRESLLVTLVKFEAQARYADRLLLSPPMLTLCPDLRRYPLIPRFPLQGLAVGGQGAFFVPSLGQPVP